MTDAFLLAYFTPESAEDGERIRLAVSDPGNPERWTAVAGGRPILESALGERGARDPFLLRDPASGEVVLLATDLRVFPDDDWARAVRHGSRALLVWRTRDLVTWQDAQLVTVAPDCVGNVWAPKAYWSAERDAWLVIWASARYADTDARERAAHQALLAATTRDFREFGPSFVYLDPGHDVIDAAFVEAHGRSYRFSANSLGEDPDTGRHILVEVGDGLEDEAFAPVVVDLGKPELVHAEGPAPFVDTDRGLWYVLIDENGHRGYQLYRTTDPASGSWSHVQDAVLPSGARHGSVLPITLEERERLLAID